MRTSRAHLIAVILAAIVGWAAVLRLAWCDSSPRGLQVDEASNAWNAWCLLKTGQDEWGQRWPIFYTRAFDDYRSPLYLYLLLPFQAIGGMNVYTTRLPAAIGGVVTVLLVYYIGRRMFDAPTGLVAAALLTLSPWHIQHTRWGHEGTIGPLLFAGACAAVLWAGAPCIDAPRQRRAGAAAALLAGVITGIACYGYAALRLVIPATFLLGFLATCGSWTRFVRQRQGLLAFAAMILGLAVTLGPLVHKHLTDPVMNRRLHHTLVWTADDSIGQRAWICLARYAAHFGPWFLFTHGSNDPVFSPPAGHGFVSWYALPPLVIGVGVLMRRARASPSARLLLMMLLAYPAGDVIFGLGTAPHPLRSFAGVVPLSLSAAVGAVGAARWLAGRWRPLYATTIGGFCGWIIVAHALHAVSCFGRFDNDAGRYWQHHVDLMQACQWLKPRFDQADAVFCTQQAIPFPHAMMLVFLNYEPRRWFAEPREYAPCPPTLQAEQVCTRFGKVRLMYNPQGSLDELLELGRNDRSDRVVLILRPDQKAGPHQPVETIAACGAVWLHLYELDI